MEPVKFEAPLELLAWGRNTYTVLYLDELLEDAVRAAGTRRVEGTIEGVEVNLGVNRADVALRPFCYVGAALQRRLQATAGDVIACSLGPADPDQVPLADDVRLVLEAAGRLRPSNAAGPRSAGRTCSPSTTQHGRRPGAPGSRRS